MRSDSYWAENCSAPVFPVHSACLSVFSQAVINNSDSDNLDRNALYFSMRKVVKDYHGLKLEYKVTGNDQDWLSIPGEEVTAPKFPPMVDIGQKS